MGCGGSKMGGSEGDDLPARIRPLLRRRLEEMKKRNQARVLKGQHTLSKKQLLMQGSEDGEEMEHDGSLRSSAKVAPAPENEEINNKEVIYEEKEKEKAKEKEKKIEHDVFECAVEGEKIIEVVKEQEAGDGDHDDDVAIKNEVVVDDSHVLVDNDKEEEEAEEKGRMSSFDERMICPGSPSFRIYCINISDDDDDESQDKEGEEKKKKHLENGNIDPKEDESIKRVKKTERKGRRFGISLPKRAIPRMYLFNVTPPCYISASGCIGHNHSRLLQDK